MTLQPSENRTSILLFGHDIRLVETRRWVLERSGFKVITALNFQDLERLSTKELFDLVLLCDSLLPLDRNRAIVLCEAQWPGRKRLVLVPMGFSPDLGVRETLFPAAEGPRKLVATIHNLMTSGTVPLR
jgi:hypothetical protein